MSFSSSHWILNWRRCLEVDTSVLRKYLGRKFNKDSQKKPEKFYSQSQAVGTDLIGSRIYIRLNRVALKFKMIGWEWIGPLICVLQRRGENIGTHPPSRRRGWGTQLQTKGPQDRWEPPESEEEARTFPPLEPARAACPADWHLGFRLVAARTMKECTSAVSATQHMMLCMAALKNHPAQFREECAWLDLGLRARRRHCRNPQQLSSTYAHSLERQTPSAWQSRLFFLIGG